MRLASKSSIQMASCYVQNDSTWQMRHFKSGCQNIFQTNPFKFTAFSLTQRCSPSIFLGDRFCCHLLSTQQKRRETPQSFDPQTSHDMFKNQQSPLTSARRLKPSDLTVEKSWSKITGCFQCCLKMRNAECWVRWPHLFAVSRRGARVWCVPPVQVVIAHYTHSTKIITITPTKRPG